MAIALAGTPQTLGSGGSTATSVPNIPLASTTAGDYNIIALSVNSTGTGVDPTPILPTGWTLLYTSGKTGTPYHRLYIISRFFVAGDNTTQTVSWTNTGNGSAICVAYSGVDSTTPNVSGEGLAQAQGASSTSWNTGSITTAAARWVVAVFANRTSGTWSALTDTNRGTIITASSANLVYEDTNGAVTAGTYSKTATYSVATSVGNTAIFALNPAASGGASGTASATLTATGTATGSPTGSASITLTATQNAATSPASGSLAVTLTAAGSAGASVSASGSLTLNAAGVTPIISAVTGSAKLYVAHRNGYGSTLGEGTLEGYRAAYNQYPAALLELPVWKCSTGEYVVIHNRTTAAAFNGTSVDVTVTPWSTLSTYTTIVGSNPMRRLTDITTAFPSSLFVIDNKQDTGAAGLIALMDSVAPGRWMGKQYYTASVSWLTSCQNDGVPVWAYFYPPDLGNLSTTYGNLSASKSPIVFGLGDYSAAPLPVQSDANTFFAFTQSHGLKTWADILQTTTQKATADSQASTASAAFDGYMISGFAVNAPFSASGISAALSLVGSAGASAQVTLTGALTLSAAGGSLGATATGTVTLAISAFGSVVGPQGSYFYSPPTWDNVGVMGGSLRYRIPTSTTTFRLNGAWHNVQSPGVGVTDGADYVFCTPTQVTAAIANEMMAAGVPGTFS